MKTSKNKYITFILRDDGILVGEFSENLVIDLDIAKEVLFARKEFTNYQDVPALIDVTNLRGITKDARNFMASCEAAEFLIASAFVTQSILPTFILQFFLKVDALGPCTVPSKIFRDKGLAINWLNDITNG